MFTEKATATITTNTSRPSHLTRASDLAKRVAKRFSGRRLTAKSMPTANKESAATPADAPSRAIIYFLRIENQHLRDQQGADVAKIVLLAGELEAYKMAVNDVVETANRLAIEATTARRAATKYEVGMKLERKYQRLLTAELVAHKAYIVEAKAIS